MAITLRTPLVVRHAIYAARGGFLVRPMAIAIVLGAVGVVLPWIEAQAPALNSFVPGLHFPSRADPQVAQAILGDIATSIMTVVSIVFAILLMTLTLASMQFSPRILVSFVRDRVTQWTLGVFLGTFSYCMAALPAARFTPQPFSPVVTVMGAMILALVCVGWLLVFIHHISQAISVNHIVDRIARETEQVIADIMPHARSSATRHHHPEAGGELIEEAVSSAASGYLRFVDTAALLRRAKDRRLRIRLVRRVGQFVPAGFPLLMVARTDPLQADDVEALHRAVDVGPTRTLQQDAEFGVLQIVDIALRAISPAVNDPSTAINCIDQLSRVMIAWIRRDPAETYLSSPPHVVRVVMPWITTDGFLDTAFDQIRHYAAGDVAVSLRLLRALADISRASDDLALRRDLARRGRRILESATLPPTDLARLEARQQALETA